jgi:hypothetical protein
MWHDILAMFHEIGRGFQDASQILGAVIFGVTEGRDSLITPLRWAQVSWYTYQVS